MSTFMVVKEIYRSMSKISPLLQLQHQDVRPDVGDIRNILDHVLNIQWVQSGHQTDSVCTGYAPGAVLKVVKSQIPGSPRDAEATGRAPEANHAIASTEGNWNDPGSQDVRTRGYSKVNQKVKGSLRKRCPSPPGPPQNLARDIPVTE